MKSNNAEYAKYLQSNQWRDKRLTVLARDNYSCQCCGQSNTALDIHHLTYDRIYEEALYDLVSLCRNCHLSHHNSGTIEQQAQEEYLYKSKFWEMGFKAHNYPNIKYAHYGDEEFCIYQIDKIAESIKHIGDNFYIINHNGIVCVWNDTKKIDYGVMLSANAEKDFSINGMEKSFIKGNKIYLGAVI